MKKRDTQAVTSSVENSDVKALYGSTFNLILLWFYSRIINKGKDNPLLTSFNKLTSYNCFNLLGPATAYTPLTQFGSSTYLIWVIESSCHSIHIGHFFVIHNKINCVFKPEYFETWEKIIMVRIDIIGTKNLFCSGKEAQGHSGQGGWSRKEVLSFSLSL